MRAWPVRFLAAACVSCAGSWVGAGFGFEGPALVIEGGAEGAPAGPLRVSVPGGSGLEAGDYLLEGSSDSKDGKGPLFATVIEDAGGLELILTAPATGAGERARYSIRRALPDRSLRGFRFEAPEEGEKDLTLRLDGGVFATYRGGEPFKPYFFPLTGPRHRMMTRQYPMAGDVPGEKRDHPHQRSMWFTHGDVNGLDFWASDPLNRANPKFGVIRETGRPTATAGRGGAVLRTTNAWSDQEGKRVLEDERVHRFYARDAGGTRFVDFEITMTAKHGRVTFGDTKEGSFGIRVPTALDVDTKPGGGTIVNAEGLRDAAAWGKASPWVDYSGTLDGDSVGIAILNHPESFRYPTTWHVRTYGLFAANPFGYTDFGFGKPGAHTLEPGESLTLKYRVVLHEGDAATADVAGAFRGYASGPRARIEME